ncbi:MAG: hypothetical protein UY21_C0016G0009 [Microgenomates group bacterium GW2011_GWA1_48_10]|uniref:Glycoside hydrolase family 5 domain-containing protein n=1 Tax=Candidatus Gottesmanbacteria bacterium RIFCSPHIGHO2_01_FULL_47_48 TaxID=1798381 RepID=A0A1F5ZZ36_9BACT|nr:MAG: hypothetical protein UY21_C0016G0009 [Microgenomates group bacterium GW2011_GWA1_48_10]OGG17720.1 MAG: hypothetical protein A2721_00565 [Candidatus Gottesmanbacteria bacterium RIFCSPHIGHO2_01_FULL_47_48]
MIPQFPKLVKIFTLTIVIILISHFSFLKSVEAAYDPLSVPNNRWGIHILETAEVGKAAEFVNSGGGDWGYVTIPIRANERDLEKWTKFMTDCRRLHLIPILRIAQFPKDGGWAAPNEWDLVDFANFLNDLPWPTKNRYIVIYNEPNHQGEWGGFVYPEEYARVLDRAIDIFHKKNPDFFVISAGFDSSAPNAANSMAEMRYLQIIIDRYPGIFSRLDGFSSHAYGNPSFTTAPNSYSRVNISNYRYEQNFLKTFNATPMNIFITEGGWDSQSLGDARSAAYYLEAFQNVWTDPNIVAITPFLLQASDGPFQKFSFIGADQSFKSFAKAIMNLPKISGRPILTDQSASSRTVLASPNNANSQASDKTGFFTSVSALVFSFLKSLNILI